MRYEEVYEVHPLSPEATMPPLGLALEAGPSRIRLVHPLPLVITPDLKTPQSLFGPPAPNKLICDNHLFFDVCIPSYLTWNHSLMQYWLSWVISLRGATSYGTPIKTCLLSERFGQLLKLEGYRILDITSEAIFDVAVAIGRRWWASRLFGWTRS